MNNIKNMAIKESVFLKFLKFPCPQMKQAFNDDSFEGKKHVNIKLC